MPTVRDGGVVWCEVCQQSDGVWCGVRCVRCANSQTEVWCEVCQQSETEVWCGVRCVSSQYGTNSSRHTLEYTTSPSTASLANDRFAAVHWAGQPPHQLTVDLARRAHQSPGRLVDEGGLGGLPLAQRTGQG